MNVRLFSTCAAQIFSEQLYSTRQIICTDSVKSSCCSDPNLSQTKAKYIPVVKVRVKQNTKQLNKDTLLSLQQNCCQYSSFTWKHNKQKHTPLVLNSQWVAQFFTNIYTWSLNMYHFLPLSVADIQRRSLRAPTAVQSVAEAVDQQTGRLEKKLDPALTGEWCCCTGARPRTDTTGSPCLDCLSLPLMWT